MTRERSPGAEVLTNRQMDPHKSQPHNTDERKTSRKGVTKSAGWVNFINILRVAFLYESVLQSFLYSQFVFKFFCGEKKLTPGVNFTNIL